LVPPISNIFRIVTDETEIGGYRIPRGWKISVSLPEMHNVQDIDMSVDHATLKQTENCPYGLGNRMCAGYRFANLELMVWLMYTLSNYQVSVAASREIKFPFHYMTVQASFRKTS